jgi:ribosomal protein S27AE
MEGCVKDAVQIVPMEGGFTLMVMPRGLWDQWLFFVLGVIPLAFGWGLTDSFVHGTFKVNDRPAEPWEIVYILPFWIGGLGVVAAGVQRAWKRVVFTVDAERMVIGTKGPFWRSLQEYPREALRGVAVAESSVVINGDRLQELELHFAEQDMPLTVLRGWDPSVLRRVALELTEAMALGREGESAMWRMEVREAPIHAGIFKMMCGIGVGIGLVLILLQGVIGLPMAAVGFFVTVVILKVITVLVLRKARCPQCGEEIRLDKRLSAERYRYTCGRCRIVWQSLIGPGGPES